MKIKINPRSSVWVYLNTGTLYIGSVSSYQMVEKTIGKKTITTITLPDDSVIELVNKASQLRRQTVWVHFDTAEIYKDPVTETAIQTPVFDKQNNLLSGHYMGVHLEKMSKYALEWRKRNMLRSDKNAVPKKKAGRKPRIKLNIPVINTALLVQNQNMNNNTQANNSSQTLENTTIPTNLQPENDSELIAWPTINSCPFGFFEQSPPSNFLNDSQNLNDSPMSVTQAQSFT